jgi:hypothetical protein
MARKPFRKCAEQAGQIVIELTGPKLRVDVSANPGKLTGKRSKTAQHTSTPDKSKFATSYDQCD